MTPVVIVIGRDEGNWSYEPDVKDISPRLKQKKLNVEARLWHQIIVTYLDLAQHDTTLSHNTAIMIWSLMEEKKINLPRVLKDAMHKGNRRDKPIIEFDTEIEKTLKKNRSRVKPQRALQFDQEEVNSEEGASLDPVTPEHEPPSVERSEDFMDAEGGEDDDLRPRGMCG
ncbi:hypothetical protein PIB30_089145 [Stylosanthes scabra]|uniref:Uncharacterized protein n=1 Tax=Stylosanthes scabra TaxID=79078 RepID=A0ABU6VUU7_9FABA|nr:hypothetical protein [Stylosanthes scabra]